MFQKIKSYLFNFFHFNKQERNGVFVLFAILAILFLIKLVLPFFITNDAQLIMKDSDSLNKINALDTFVNEKKIINKKEINTYIEKELFVFNPNTISSEEALKLGFSKKLTSILINFRNKGGKFFKPEDLKKLYGLSPKLFQSLESYILIPNNKKEFKKDSTNYKSFPKKTYTKTSVELNSADSLSIVYLKGIGPSFTKRIIKYRTMLGGFHNINQLKEVYGMTDSLFLSLSSQVQIDKTKLTPIPINAIDLNSLRKHPYFNFQTAQAIINFRFKHGKLTEKDIIDLGIFNSEKLSVILPYLTY